jgi:rod shape-determining protein MreC
MAGFIVRRKDPLLFVTILLVLLAILASQAENERGDSLLSRTVMEACSPFVRLSAGAAQKVRDTWFGYFNLVDARAKNRRTMDQYDRQALELALLRERLRTYERSEALLRFIQELEIPGEEPVLESISPALVISNRHSDEQQSRVLLLNRGSSAGLKKNMPVITSDGVVGKTVSCTRWVSTVLLATDVNSGISVRVARGESRVWGMITGGAVMADGRPALEMQHVSSLDDVVQGDRVVTSGLDGIYPAGLTVGTVFSVEDGLGLSKKVLVEPAVKMSLLEEVLVLVREEQLPSQLAPEEEGDTPVEEGQ